MKKIKVNLRENSYEIYIGYPLEKIGEKFKGKKFGEKVIVLSDENVFPVYGEKVLNSLSSIGKKVKEIVLKPGEKTKNLTTVFTLLRECGYFEINRDDTLLTLGGGVVSDIGGFVASIYMRGINFVSVPTSLLAQVDAAIGGKTGVNLPFGKNLVGSFYQPSFVYIDISTISTLPPREVKQGIAEIIKYGVIKNKRIFETLEKIDFRNIGNHCPFLIEESIKIKVEVVEKDEKERKGLREILNFGHTLGHAIEISNITNFTHGEAISLGMVGETFIAYKMGICRSETVERIKNVIEKFNLPSSFKKIDIDKFVEFLKYDKKIKKGKLRFVLPEKIGKVKRGVVVEKKEIIKILKEVRKI